MPNITLTIDADHLDALADAISHELDMLLDDLHDDPTNEFHPPRIAACNALLDALPADIADRYRESDPD